MNIYMPAIPNSKVGSQAVGCRGRGGCKYKQLRLTMRIESRKVDRKK